MGLFVFSISRLKTITVMVFTILISACGSESENGPDITIIGENPVTLIQGYTYVDDGATAIDANGNAVELSIRSDLDIQTPGDYTITYKAVDEDGDSSKAHRSIIVVPARPFITTWKFNGYGETPDLQARIGTWGDGYDYQVDWGDGQTDSGVKGDIAHTYEEAGTYTVAITGDFPQTYFDDGASTCKNLASIEQWGDIQWKSMRQAFYQCLNFSINASDAPNLTQVTDMSYAFYLSSINEGIGNWDVSNVTNMSNMFNRAYWFDGDIGNWDVSNVTNMEKMFNSARAFNQDINSWDVSSVTDMTYMFYGTALFNQNLNGWDVSLVTDMSHMFHSSAFNQEIGNWNVSSVTDMNHMFYGTRVFNQAIGNWDVSSVTDMSVMFFWALKFNQNINNWDVSSVTTMEFMFYKAREFNQPLNNWDVSSVTTMRRMFEEAELFNQPLNNWDVSSVTTMERVFSRAKAFNQPLNNWDVSSVTSMEEMFSYALAFDQDIGAWDISSVRDFSFMISEKLSTENYDALLIGWSGKNVQESRFFDADLCTYSTGAQAARDILVDGYGWHIDDAGLEQ